LTVSLTGRQTDPQSLRRRNVVETQALNQAGRQVGSQAERWQNGRLLDRLVDRQTRWRNVGGTAGSLAERRSKIKEIRRLA
jgi:hypothetical protein